MADLQSRMLQALICFRTSGHTAAWHALYLATYSGFNLTIWATRRPGLGWRVESNNGGVSRGGGLTEPSGGGEAGFGLHSCDMLDVMMCGKRKPTC